MTVILMKGFHDITSFNWTWPEMASSYLFGETSVAHFYALKYVPLLGSALALNSINSATWYWKNHRVICLGLVATWVGHETIPVVNKISPYVFLITRIGITALDFFVADTKQLILQVCWTAIVFTIKTRRTAFIFHHVITAPMFFVMIRFSSGISRITCIFFLVLRTISHYPKVQAALKPYFSSNSIVELGAMGCGVIPHNTERFLELLETSFNALVKTKAR